MKYSVSQFIRNRRSTLKLAATYLAVIMVMSLIYSAILFLTSIHGFDKRPNIPPPATHQQDSDHEIDEWLGRRAADNKTELAVRLIILNFATLFAGAFLSYYLARRTLRPIEEVMKEQERFIADASHELRTPLTSILLSNEVALRKKNLHIADAKLVIEQNIADMQELKLLSDELLDVSIDKRKPGLRQTVNLDTVIKNSINHVQSVADKKHITITAYNADVHVQTDRTLLGKILVILLDNAVKYSPEKSNVKVSVIQNNTAVGIAIADEGIGIAPKDIDHIFERFYRADTSRSLTAGHGLGLSIAAQCSEKLGAKVTVKSELNKGSTFTIWLS